MIKLIAACLDNLTRLSLRALVKTSLAAMTALVLSAYTHANVDRVSYLHYDGLGSAIAATDEQGAIKWRENYQPYGQRTEYETDNHTVWFTGKPEEADFELQYYGGRWYDPNLGRFNSIDPQGFVESSPMSFNRYAYANNNPYSYVDPDGELPFLVPLAIFLVKEAAAEVASHYTDGWSDFLSARRMVTAGARYLSRTLRRGGGDVTKRTGPKGVDPNHHNANVMVKDANGNVVSHERIVSGNMTPAEKALGFPKNTLASHTEARAVTNTPLKAGDTMTITGQKRPCPSCKGYMNRANAETGATIRYQWRENGQTQRWTTGGN